MAVDHYENFPVASLLCPPALRPPIAAIYHFARTADDIAAARRCRRLHRLCRLAAYRVDLTSALSQTGVSKRWAKVFGPLAQAVVQWQLPGPLLHDLISAFEQDVRYTAAGHCYADRTELLAYCQLSANPVGRLLLHLYGIGDETSLQQSDHICSALQLINFWQDLSIDIPRGRHYLPSDALLAAGLARHQLLAQPRDTKTIQLIANEVGYACEEMHKGQALAKTIPGRAGWELRLVVQGGLRIADKIAKLNYATLQTRPRVRGWDAPLMLWRAALM